MTKLSFKITTDGTNPPVITVLENTTEATIASVLFFNDVSARITMSAPVFAQATFASPQDQTSFLIPGANAEGYMKVNYMNSTSFNIFTSSFRAGFISPLAVPLQNKFIEIISF